MSELGPLLPPPGPPGDKSFPHLAGLWQRFIGRFLDGIVLLAPALLWIYVLKDAGRSAADSRTTFYFLVLAFSFANDVALTALTGRSIGKMITGTRVVLGDEGTPITMGAAVLRWVVMMLLNVIPFGGIVDAAYIFSGEKKQTLHDRAAGTLVVRVTL
jgi:uncharacterized RDD family membrane protein YckC